MLELEQKITIQPGYSERLLFLMKLAGHRQHGTVATITRYALMSRTGGLKMMEADRPPAKQESLDNLVSKISEDFLRLKKTPVSTEDITAYLLYNTSLPVYVLSLIPNHLEADASDRALEYIHHIADKIGFKLEDVTDVNLLKVQTKVAHYCSKNSITNITDKLESIITSLLTLAAEDELI